MLRRQKADLDHMALDHVADRRQQRGHVPPLHPGAAARVEYRLHLFDHEGNVAAAISLSGAILGFMLPLASAIAHSVSLIDMLVWGVVALVVQLAVFAVVNRALPHFGEAIRAGRTAAATLLASLAIAVGLLNAACMTY